MAEGVAADIQHLKLGIQRRQFYRVAIVQRVGQHVNLCLFCSRAIDRHGGMCQQFADAADVVVMAMRDQDGAELRASLLQIVEDGAGFTGIHHGDLVTLAQGPDVIVAESVQGADFHNPAILLEAAALKPPMANTGFIEWLDSEQGQYVRRWVELRHDQLVADIFGFNAVQIGLPQLDLLRANRMPFRFQCGEELPAHVLATPFELPFASGSIDLVVLPHVLEFSDNPHQVLREVERVLMPEGSVLITGFNPYSLWGMRRRMSAQPAAAPWRGRYISVPRLKDWFTLLGLETHMGCFGCYAPALKQQKWLSRWRFMEDAGDRWWPFAGGVYMLQAIKRVHGMRLIKPSWKDRRSAAKALSPVIQRQTKIQRTEE